MTHTYAILPLSKAAYDEIRAALTKAEYTHAFHEEGIIDMHGIAVQAYPEGRSAAIQVPVRSTVYQGGIRRWGWLRWLGR